MTLPESHWQKFRKKPVVIEAFQWTSGMGTCLPEIAVSLIPHGYFLPTKEGPMFLTDGDWIIRGVKGELYPCKPDIFEMSYDPA